MTSLLNPYLSFDGDAAEAMKFYQSVFGGKLEVNTFGQSGFGEGAAADRVMHARLTADNGFNLMGADMPPGSEHKPGNNIAISLSGDDGDTLRGYWDKLSTDGSVMMTLEKQVWGDEFGMCADRFGIAWMVNIGPPQGG